MKHFEVWPVAAAVLIKARRELHYEEIARRVMDTGLTTLGFKGETPHQSIGALMRKHDKVFSSPRRGFYAISSADRVAQMPDVAKAIDAMRQRPSMAQPLSEVDDLKAQIRSLEARNAVLQEKISYIAKICESVRSPS